VHRKSLTGGGGGLVRSAARASGGAGGASPRAVLRPEGRSWRKSGWKV